MNFKKSIGTCKQQLVDREPSPPYFFYAAREGKGRGKNVGPEFNCRQVAIGAQLDSPLRKKIDRALVALRENGMHQQIYGKCFGGHLGSQPKGVAGAIQRQCLRGQ
jgi:ABC-type amino acid transport substrate-binding protein